MEKYVPKSAKGKQVKYLGISAHKDDLELMAFDGIVKGQREYGFVGVVLTDGAGCVKVKPYDKLTDAQMVDLRTKEQKEASEIGAYESLYLLEYSSAQTKSILEQEVMEVAEVIKQYPNLDAIYIHSPFDNHPTHIAACKVVLEALKKVPKNCLPKKLYGCEVWGSLEWLPDNNKVIFDVSGNYRLANKIMGAFTSQNLAQHYDRAIVARRRANATFAASHAAANSNALAYAVDLTEVMNGDISITDFIDNVINKFRTRIKNNF